MFADSLLDSSVAERSHRASTTFASFSLQALLITGLLLFSVLRIERLPATQFTSALVAPAPLPPSPMITPSHPATGTLPATGPIMRPTYKPRGLSPNTSGGLQPAAPDYSQLGLGDGPGPGVPFGFGNSAIVSVPPPPAVSAKPPRVSRMMEGNLVTRIQPVYPPLARQARVQGSVQLRAIISREGTIENLQVLNGHPLLVKSAIDAVRQWRYRPYYLNGEPIEVETEITVNFSLGN